MSSSIPQELRSNPNKSKKGLLSEILALEQATQRKLIAPQRPAINDIGTMGAQLIVGGG